MQVTKMIRRATAKTVRRLACHSLCSQRDTRAKSRASVQMKASTAQTRLAVTICWYLRWKNKAAYRSRLIAAKFKSEAVLNMDAVTTSELKSKHWTRSGKVPRRKRNAAHWGVTTEPAPRSVSTREQSRSLDGRRMDVTRRIANRTTRLATVVATANGTFKAAFKSMEVMCPNCRRFQSEKEHRPANLRSLSQWNYLGQLDCWTERMNSSAP